MSTSAQKIFNALTEFQAELPSVSAAIAPSISSALSGAGASINRGGIENAIFFSPSDKFTLFKAKN